MKRQFWAVEAERDGHWYTSVYWISESRSQARGFQKNIKAVSEERTRIVKYVPQEKAK